MPGLAALHRPPEWSRPPALRAGLRQGPPKPPRHHFSPNCGKGSCHRPCVLSTRAPSDQPSGDLPGHRHSDTTNQKDPVPPSRFRGPRPRPLQLLRLQHVCVPLEGNSSSASE